MTPPTARRLRVVFSLAGLALLHLLFFAPLPERAALSGSVVVRDAEGAVLHAFLSPDEKWRIPVAREEVDPQLITGLVALEDARFFLHPGVDPLAILRAAGQNLAAGQVVSGASTLTMQTIRLLEPRPRTLRSKAIEAVRALQLTAQRDKDEVLGLWLQFAPFGRNVEGVEAAAWALFGHSAQALSPAEISLLLAIPQDPNGRSPRHPQALRAGRRAVARRLIEAGVFDAATTLEDIERAPLPTQLAPLPRAAIHAARWMRARAGGLRIDTTLDRGVQALVERRLAERARGLRAVGVHNAAVVVVDWRSRALVALAGGLDFWDDDHGGQIPAFAVPRSPGSALKPLLYARALDLGLALPQTAVEDVPTRFGDYAPLNYDGAFSGLLPLEEALSRSLNLPFVRLLSQIGVERFLGDLRGAGVRSLREEPGHYGLSAAVGGVEITPIELAGLYASLADAGQHKVLRWRAADPEGEGIALWSPEAAYLTTQALRRRDRPDFPDRVAAGAVPQHLFWKTGTSYGNRDALAAGAGRRYAAVVWLGNLDNRSSAHLVGAELAAPLLFDILEGLGDGHAGDPPPPPKGLGEVNLCALSGKLPGAACTQTRLAPALAARIPTDRCDQHENIEVDAQSGLRVRPGCRSGPTRLLTVTRWPAAVRRWLGPDLTRGTPIPAWAPGCAPQPIGPPPRILHPLPGAVLKLISGLEATAQEVELRAEAAPEVRLSWFVDGVWLGSAGADETLWWTPSPGAHEIVALDEAGRADRRALRVDRGSEG